MNKNEKFVITINREAGSGGRTVGRKLAEKLGVKYCDKAIVEGLTKKFGLSIERIEEIKAQKKSWWTDINNYYNTLVNSASQPMDAQVKLDNTSIFETEKRMSVMRKLVTSLRNWMLTVRPTSRSTRTRHAMTLATTNWSFRWTT